MFSSILYFLSMEPTELLGMFQQRWVGVKSASFDCILVFPCRHSNGERAAPWDGHVDPIDVRLREVNSGQLRHSKISPAFPALTPSSSLSSAHFLYLFKKLPFFPFPSLFLACVLLKANWFPVSPLSLSLPFSSELGRRNRHHRRTTLSLTTFTKSWYKNKIFSFKIVVSREGEGSWGLVTVVW